MEQVGVVVETMEDKARVKTRRHTACSKCGKCDGGLLGMESHQDLTVVVKNPVGAREGDLVRLETAARGVLLAAFLVYIFPLINLFLGFALGKWLAQSLGWENTEGTGVVLGLALLAGTFFLLRSQEGRLARNPRFAPVITRVLNNY